MIKDIFLPKLDIAMEDAKIIEWKKKVGDKIKKGETLVEIEASKANVEIEAEFDGILKEILVQSGEIINVGTIVAQIEI